MRKDERISKAVKNRHSMKDCCPDCFTINAPYYWLGLRDETVKAVYRCANCQRAWSCWWSKACVGV